jgi:hypothetical protein
MQKYFVTDTRKLIFNSALAAMPQSPYSGLVVYAEIGAFTLLIMRVRRKVATRVGQRASRQKRMCRLGLSTG